MIQEVFTICDKIEDGRSISDIFLALSSEMGELATEIGIEKKFILKEPSEDGVVGEAVDVIVSALDIIRTHCPDLTPQEVEDTIIKKATKWLNKKTQQGNTIT